MNRWNALFVYAVCRRESKSKCFSDHLCQELIRYGRNAFIYFLKATLRFQYGNLVFAIKIRELNPTIINGLKSLVPFRVSRLLYVSRSSRYSM